MQEARFSWLVVAGNEALQVNADECRHEPNGGLSFWNSTSDGARYMTTAFPPGAWQSADIMSQMTGEPNGHAVVSTRKSESSPWQHRSR